MIYVVGPRPSAKGGIASVLACLRDHGFFEAGAGVVFVPSFETGSKMRKMAVALRGLARVAADLVRGHVSVLHVHSAFGASFLRKSLFASLAFLCRVPVVFHIHNGAFEVRLRASPAMARAFVRWVLLRCACIVVLTHSQRDYVTRVLGHPWVELFPNPIDVPSAGGLGWPREPVAAFLANLSREKGVFDLLEAWKLVVQRVPEAQLALCGLGDRQAVTDAIASSGLESSVRLLGWVTAEQKRGVLAESRVVVLPSRSEALPMSVLEGMAHGCAIVATRVGAVPDAVRDGIDGRLVDVGDVPNLARALADLLTDPIGSARMGTAARARAEEKYSADAVMRQYRRLYNDVSQRV